ncbi:kinase-like protein [Rhizoctonia solani]|nr:kinase-like protein [Rhizoctonia solani]
MISLWMKYGSLPSYLESVPGVNRFDMCVQICEALSYLHQIGIVHGDLKGANVLVSEDGFPVLTDFGNSLLADRTLRFTQTTSSSSFTVRWSAPEIIEESTSHTEASDVYALGMTIYEILTGKVPYHGKNESNVIRLVTVKKEFPERLEFMLNNGRNAGNVWELLVQCWSYESALRPSAAEMTKNMKEISLTS